MGRKEKAKIPLTFNSQDRLIMLAVIGALGNIIGFGTPSVDENEVPCGVCIEGTCIESKRFYEVWKAAIDLLDVFEKDFGGK